MTRDMKDLLRGTALALMAGAAVAMPVGLSGSALAQDGETIAIARDNDFNSHHSACNFQTGQVRCTRGCRIQAAPLHDVWPVHPGCCHLDKDFVNAGQRSLATCGHQYLGPTGLLNLDTLHLRHNSAQGIPKAGFSHIPSQGRK